MKDNKKVIVIGAAGFIGTYLIDELLKNNFHVLAADINDIGRSHYDQQGVSLQIIDVTNKHDIQKLPNKGVDAVINLACIQPANVSKEMYNPVDYINVNVIGTLNLLEYCRTSKIPKMIIATSHRNTKGLWKEGKKIREEEGRAIEFTGEYAMFSISEGAATDCVEHYNCEFGLQGIVFRLSPVYGYGPHTVIFKNGKETTTGFQAFIDQAASGMPIEIWGDPDVGRDIIYVKDVVNAFILALNNTTAKGLKINDLYTIIARSDDLGGFSKENPRTAYIRYPFSRTFRHRSTSLNATGRSALNPLTRIKISRRIIKQAPVTAL